MAVADGGTHHARQLLALRLLPREAELKRRLRWIRLFIDRETFRIVRVEIEWSSSREAWTIGDVEEIDPDEATAIEPDLSRLKLEER